jgi:hypothetical protein
MKRLRHPVRNLSGLAVLCVAGLALFVLCSANERPARVVFSNGSWLAVRKVTYGKDNVYYHNPVRRAAAALVSDSTWNRVFDKWASRLGVTSVDSQVLSGNNELVVFGDVSFLPGGTRFWEFIGVDANGNEGGPLETMVLDAFTGPTAMGPGLLADGNNAPNSQPIAVRIYELNTNGTRKLLAAVPVQRKHR